MCPKQQSPLRLVSSPLVSWQPSKPSPSACWALTASQAPPIKPVCAVLMREGSQVTATPNTNKNSCWRSFTAFWQLPTTWSLTQFNLQNMQEHTASKGSLAHGWADQSEEPKVSRPMVWSAAELCNDAMSPIILSQNTALISLALQ